MSRLFLPAGTNYLPNPGFRLDDDANGVPNGFGQSLSNVDLTNTLTEGVVDGVACKIWRMRLVGLAGVGTSGTCLSSGVTDAGTFAQNDYATLAFSMRVIESTGCGVNLMVSGRDAAGSSLGSTTGPAIPVSADFTRVGLTRQLVEAGTSRARFYIVTSNFHEGDVLELEVALAMAEKSSVLTPYFDGSTVDANNSCSWSGAANASTSVRAASRFDLAVVAGAYNSGTFAAKIVSLFPGNDGQVRPVFSVKDVPGASYSLYLTKHTADCWRFYAKATGTNSIISGALSFAAGTAHTLVGRWTQGPGGVLDLNHDGTTVAQVAQAEVLATGTEFNIGTLIGGTPICAYLGPILISPARKPDSWVTAIQANSGAAFGSIDRLKREFMAPGDALITFQGSDRKIYVKGS